MTKIAPADALALAKRFKTAALALGQFQLDHWEMLAPRQRQALTDKEYALLGASQNLITGAVGVLLDETQTALADIQQATAKANQALQTVKDIKQALAIATAFVTLGIAVCAGNPGGLATAVGGLLAVAET